MSSSPPLPTPRQLLTSILNAISRIPTPEQQQQQQQAQGGGSKATTISRVTSLQVGNEATQPATNPLRLIDPAHRPLFTTLHVLFPSLLLPALDLLDRALVTRLLLPGRAGNSTDAKGHDGDDVEMRDGDGDGDDEGVEAMGQASSSSSSSSSSPAYLVRSAQKPTRRPFGGGGGGDPAATSGGGGSSSTTQRTYVVQTAAWNCTCAAFAFSAFPPAAGWSSLPLGRTTVSMGAKDKGNDKGKGVDVDVDVDHDDPSGLRAATAGEEEEEEEEEDGKEGDTDGGPAAGWQFGGLSYDGCAGGLDDHGDGGGEAVPPCCKHLLACVLAERWDATLGRYLVKRTVGREEMAGIFADI